MKLTAVLACREGLSWVVQAIEQDVASQGASMIEALIIDLGRMFDARDAIVAIEANVAPVPRAPASYDLAISQGLYVGLLPLGVVRVADVYIGISPYARSDP
jgi:hypothetical protein